MYLSAELFQSVVQAMRVEEADDHADPRFSTLCARRVRLGGRALVIPCTGQSAGEVVDAVARDVSPSGIALTLPLRLVHGQRFILHLARPCGCLAGAMSGYSILCTVARYQHTGDGLYTLGATFTRVLGGIGYGARFDRELPLAAVKDRSQVASLIAASGSSRSKRANS